MINRVLNFFFIFFFLRQERKKYTKEWYVKRNLQIFRMTPDQLFLKKVGKNPIPLFTE
jgi:hypothetical protein